MADVVIRIPWNSRIDAADQRETDCRDQFENWSRNDVNNFKLPMEYKPDYILSGAEKPRI